MDELGLFTAALGLSGPWRVARTEFDPERFQLDLYLDFDRGARFPCPAAGCAHDDCPVHDTADRRGGIWTSSSTRRSCTLGAPRVRCPEHGVRQVSVSWARPGSGVHAAVRGTGAQLRGGDGGGQGRGDDPRARHQDLARAGTPRARRPGSAGLLGGCPRSGWMSLRPPGPFPVGSPAAASGGRETEDAS